MAENLSSSIIGDSTVFTVNFTLLADPSQNQQISIIGSIPELGGWRDWKKTTMHKNGSLWQIQLQVSTPIFMYKYVKTSQNKIEEWEQGYNRIADLQTLKES